MKTYESGIEIYRSFNRISRLRFRLGFPVAIQFLKFQLTEWSHFQRYFSSWWSTPQQSSPTLQSVWMPTKIVRNTNPGALWTEYGTAMCASWTVTINWAAAIQWILRNVWVLYDLKEWRFVKIRLRKPCFCCVKSAIKVWYFCRIWFHAFKSPYNRISVEFQLLNHEVAVLKASP
jgi:hypothetical protein